MFLKFSEFSSKTKLTKLKPIMIFHYIQTSYISTLQQLIFISSSFLKKKKHIQ